MTGPVYYLWESFTLITVIPEGLITHATLMENLNFICMSKSESRDFIEMGKQNEK